MQEACILPKVDNLHAFTLASLHNPDTVLPLSSLGPCGDITDSEVALPGYLKAMAHLILNSFLSLSIITSVV